MTDKNPVNRFVEHGLTRRRFLTNAVAASSAAVAAPILGQPGRSRAQTSADGMPHTLAADASPRFRTVAETLMAGLVETGTPGGVLGIWADGHEEYAAFGRESVDADRRVTRDTLFQIGSTTKTVTGTALMRLVERGALDLDATVRSYLPEFTLEAEDVAARVTVRHLLTHTGGWWGDFFTETGSGTDAVARYVEEWVPTFPQLAPLGALFSYNNSGFTILGRLIEVITARPYSDAVHDLVLQPLGLLNTFFSPDELLARPHANGHFTDNGTPGVQDPLFLPRSVDPAGGLWSTAPDLIRYARFHLGHGAVNGVRVLSKETLDLMQITHQPIPGDPSLSMGMPWFIIDLPGHRLIWHDGSTFGQAAMLWLASERNLAVTMLLNAQPTAALAGQSALFEALVQYLDLDFGATPMSTPVVKPTPTAPSTVDLGQYAGRYEVPGAVYELQVIENVLVLSADFHRLPDQVWPSLRSELPPLIPVELIGEDLAVVTVAGVPQLLEFVRRSGGDIGWVSANLRLIPKVETA